MTEITENTEKPCERQKKGMSDNCALCEGMNKELYIKCEYW